VADNETTEAAASTEAAPAQNINIQKIYVKDVSFETPNTPAVFLTPEQVQPQVDFQLTTTANNPAEEIFEVGINITVTVKMGETVAFLVEVHQAGLFRVQGFAPDQLPYVLNSYCPNILFPYARETISSLVLHGGFAPLLLEPVNFDAMFSEQVEKMKQQQAQSTETKQ
jgi:preprotein translocase subunit SecB